MLGGLVGDRDAGARPELTRPHAGAVDDDIGFDVAASRADAGDAPAVLQHAGDRHALDDFHAPQARAFRERHGDVHRVHAAVFLHVEAGLDVLHLRQRKKLLHFARRDLVHVHAAVAVERRDPPVLFEPVLVGRDLDEADRREAGGLAGLRLQARVQGARVFAHLGRGFGG